jgi:hypothetical protein
MVQIERRRSHRARTLKAAKVILSDWTVVDCLVRDISEVGAKLEFKALTKAPKQFRLLVAAANLAYPAELEWQLGLAAGVRFTGPGVVPNRKV